MVTVVVMVVVVVVVIVVVVTKVRVVVEVVVTVEVVVDVTVTVVVTTAAGENGALDGTPPTNPIISRTMVTITTVFLKLILLGVAITTIADSNTRLFHGVGDAGWFQKTSNTPLMILSHTNA